MQSPYTRLLATTSHTRPPCSWSTLTSLSQTLVMTASNQQEPEASRACTASPKRISASLHLLFVCSHRVPLLRSSASAPRQLLRSAISLPSARVSPRNASLAEARAAVLPHPLRHPFGHCGWLSQVCLKKFDKKQASSRCHEFFRIRSLG